jgi:hypothetical protein
MITQLTPGLARVVIGERLSTTNRPALRGKSAALRLGHDGGAGRAYTLPVVREIRWPDSTDARTKVEWARETS